MQKDPSTARTAGQPPLYNSRIINAWVKYLSEFHPDIDVTRILKAVGITNIQMEDPGHWITQSQIDGFYDRVKALVDDPDLARRVGRFAVYSKRPNALQQYSFGFLDPLRARAKLI